MSGVRFERNHGFELELEGDPKMVAFIRSSTTTVAVSVKANSPRGNGPKGGGYRKRVRPRGNRVVAEDFFWFLVEFGSTNNPPYAPLRRGILAAGLRLVVDPI